MACVNYRCGASYSIVPYRFFNMTDVQKIEDPNAVGEVPVVRPGAGNGTAKEFHLSIEECRARALECAIKIDDIDKKEEFFEWIYNGRNREEQETEAGVV